MDEFCQDELWDTNLTWGNHRAYPEFTTCFQQTILTMLPSAWLWLSAPIYLYVLASYRLEPRPTTWRSVSKQSMAVIMLSIRYLQLSSVAESLTETGRSYWNAQMVGHMTEGITLICVMVYVEMERKRGFVTSGILFIYWFLSALCGSALFYSKLVQQNYDMSSNEAVLFKYYFIFTITQLILSCFAEPLPHTGGKPQCPLMASSFPSRVLYRWVNKFMNVGHQRAITEDDITPQMPKEQAANCQKVFETAWTAEERHHKLRKGDDTVPAKVSLLKVLLKCHGWDILASNSLMVVNEVFRFTAPIILGSLMGFTEDTVQPGWKGFVYLVGFVGSWGGENLCWNYTFHLSRCLNRRFAATITGAIFKKSLRMSNLSRTESTAGEIVNMLYTDMENVKCWFGFFWRLWTCPLQLVFALIMMYHLVGVSMLAGIVVFIVFMVINALIVRRTHVMYRNKMDIKNKRIKLMTEILNGIKILKLYAWEMAFGAKITNFRDEELAVVWKTRLHQMCGSVTWNLTPFLMSLAIFSSHVYMSAEHVLTAKTAFGVLAYLGILNHTVRILPDIIISYAKGWISFGRISVFLNKEEIAEDVVTHLPSDDAVTIEDGQFTWDPKLGQCLSNINLTVPTGNLVGVIGMVGSGKSSLLSAILGEMEKNLGTVNVDGTIGYVPQQAWIQNATLENNVLFGSKMMRTTYDTVIEACALTSDLEILPGKDQTEIGEKGINLSGGQKQRVSLARAVYYNADIYLLDDPLSAVDAHVGKHIFEHVIGKDGLLKNKTRILVTHGIKWLPFMDKIFVMDKGTISEAGSYTELMKHGGPFAKFIQDYDNDSASSDEEDIEIDHTSNSIMQQEMSDIGYSSDVSNERPSDWTVSFKRSISRMKSVEDSQNRLTEIDNREADDNHCHQEKHKHIRTFDDKAKMVEERIKRESDRAKGGKLIEDEELNTGKVDFTHLTGYISAMGKLPCVFVLVFFFGSKSIEVFASVWLRNWSDDKQLLNLTSLPSDSQARTDANFYYIAVYGGLGVVEAIIQIGQKMMVSIAMIRGARLLHDVLMKTILRCPMSFFDITPVGRIISRFSGDIEPLDGLVANNLMQMLNSMFGLFSVFVVISYTLPKFIIMVIPVTILYYIIQSYYVPTRRQLSRVVSKKKSPIASHLTESLNGTSVIRAFQCQERFALQSAALVDKFNGVEFILMSANRWLSLRLDGLNLSCTAVATLFAVLSRGVISGATVGLVMRYVLDLNDYLNNFVRVKAEVQGNLISIERINEYSSKKIEAPLHTSVQPSKQWPQSGQVTFKDFSIRYRDGLNLVLKGINVSVAPGEKIGIVGRTGAGKSSLTLGLFRIVEAAEGSIHIDGQDISKVGLFDLRSNLTILPQLQISREAGENSAGRLSIQVYGGCAHFRMFQVACVSGRLAEYISWKKTSVTVREPVLFCGTLRINLDPLTVHSDEAIFTALEHAHLKSFVDSLPDKLNYQCGEGGQNLSVGQRQLICLARSLLRKSNILVLDEATAAVDMKTDELIQNTIKKEFKDCTVLTIAHRLNTIIDYDRILVLERGEVQEFNKPQTLLDNKDSAFYNMAKDAGLIK